MAKNIAVIHNKVREYRVPIFQLLDSKFNVDFYIFEQSEGEYPFDVNYTKPVDIFNISRSGYYDVVILPDYVFRECWVAAIGSIFSDSNIIVWTEIWDMPHTSISKRFLKKNLARAISILSDTYIVPGKKSHSYLTQNTSARSNEIFKAPNAANIPDSDEDVSDIFDVSENDAVILYIGQLIERKRVEDLINGYTQYNNGSESKLLIGGTGDDEYSEYLRNIADSNTTEFLGWVPGEYIRPLYQLADVYVLPSLQDPYPLTVVEAMSVGTPVIVSEGVGEAGDIVRHGETGEIVPNKSPDRIADSLERLLSDDSYRESLSKRSQEVIRDNVTYEKMLTSFREAIEQATS